MFVIRLVADEKKFKHYSPCRSSKHAVGRIRLPTLKRFVQGNNVVTLETIKSMEMELNLENKAKFFAQYWGQEVLSNGIELGGCVGDCDDELFLELKPLSLITNYDLATIAEKFDISIGTGFMDIFDCLDDFKRGLDIKASWPSGLFDYLRFKGYALPWMDISLEEMVEVGWIKLIEQS